jgi:hypothetical protein
MYIGHSTACVGRPCNAVTNSITNELNFPSGSVSAYLGIAARARGQSVLESRFGLEQPHLRSTHKPLSVKYLESFSEPWPPSSPNLPAMNLLLDVLCRYFPLDEDLVPTGRIFWGFCDLAVLIQRCLRHGHYTDAYAESFAEFPRPTK